MKPRTGVYDTYWKFAAERQEIFFKKLSGANPPYTNDPILATYKFCNVYRASDRVSQFLIRNVIYNTAQKEEDHLLRILLFRLLNKIETWVLLEKETGGVLANNFNPKTYSNILNKQLSNGKPIYGNAFILCANKTFGFDRKHDNHLALIETILKNHKISKKILSAKTLEELFLNLKSLPLIGNFMAYQLAIDLNYSLLFNFDENDFTIAGPGALRGIKKCFVDTNGKSDAYIIKFMVDNQEDEFSRLGLKFKTLWSRPLQAIDCQGLFCEVDKYLRVKFPNLVSNRSKIKSKYKAAPASIEYFFPPKWNINENI